jgi:hypothetical protein
MQKIEKFELAKIIAELFFKFFSSFSDYSRPPIYIKQMFLLQPLAECWRRRLSLVVEGRGVKERGQHFIFDHNSRRLLRHRCRCLQKIISRKPLWQFFYLIGLKIIFLTETKMKCDKKTF